MFLQPLTRPYFWINLINSHPILHLQYQRYCPGRDWKDSRRGCEREKRVDRLPARGIDGRRRPVYHSGLPVGTYTVEATASGFTSSRRTGLKLAGNVTEHVSLSLN